MREAICSHRLAVYVSAAGSGDIHVIRPDQTGSLVVVQRLCLGGAIMPFAFSRDHRFLYAVDRKEPYCVHTLTIDHVSGHLQPVAKGPLAGNMVYVSTSLDERYLFTSSYSENLIAVNAIQSNGVVGETLQVLNTPKHAHAIVPTPDGNHVWVSCLGDDQLLCFQFDSEEKQPLCPEPIHRYACKSGSGPRHLAFHPNGRWLFVIHELDGCISSLELDGNGIVSQRSSHTNFLPSDIQSAPWSAELRISTDGQWLFASDRRAALLSAMRIDISTGQLHLTDCLRTDTLPRSFALSPDDSWLFVASQDSGFLSVVAFDPIEERMYFHDRLACGTNPTWVEAIELSE